jgi:hypothetical protein
VYVSVHVPTGYADKVMHVEVLDGALGVLRVQPVGLYKLNPVVDP